MRLVLGTAVLAMVVSLDGDGSTTYIIVTSALLPLYLKLKVSPVVLTVVAGLSNGAMNIVLGAARPREQLRRLAFRHPTCSCR